MYVFICPTKSVILQCGVVTDIAHLLIHNTGNEPCSMLNMHMLILMTDFYTPRNEVRGGILDSPCLSVCPSVCLSVRPSVCPLTFRVRPVASTVQDGFFPYLVQTINSMRGCVACDDL